MLVYQGPEVELIKYFFSVALLLWSFSASAYYCKNYEVRNATHDSTYLYRVSFSDIPADSPVLHLKAGKSGVLPAEAGNLLIRKKYNRDDYVHCAYSLENGHSGTVKGVSLFHAVGHACPILNVSRCDISITV